MLCHLLSVVMGCDVMGLPYDRNKSTVTHILLVNRWGMSLPEREKGKHHTQAIGHWMKYDETAG